MLVFQRSRSSSDWETGHQWQQRFDGSGRQLRDVTLLVVNTLRDAKTGELRQRR
ncbi:MAG: hypothetical protein ACLS36_10045 [Streptococcus sp.]